MRSSASWQVPRVTHCCNGRCNLASVVLQMKAMGINDVLGFDFMDQPSVETRTSIKPPQLATNRIA